MIFHPIYFQVRVAGGLTDPSSSGHKVGTPKTAPPIAGPLTPPHTHSGRDNVDTPAT